MKLSAVLLIFIVVATGAADARPLSPFFSEIFAGLSLEAIKDAGPSPGDNHAKIDGFLLGGRKASAGPSPGDNHAKIDRAFFLAGMKESVPSPGVGHSYVHGGAKSEFDGGVKVTAAASNLH